MAGARISSNRSKTIEVQSPGRINLIGEHTDYNGGWVLPAAINRYTTVRVTPRAGRIVRCSALNLAEAVDFSLDNAKPSPCVWPNYIMGVVSELEQLGAKLSGFDVDIEGEIPIGSGLSSSAALECSLAWALNEAFQLGFSPLQLIQACQMAEHNFVGTKCGIMDQFTCTMGKKDHVILLDCRSLEYRFLPFEPGQYELALLNTNVTHKLAASEYNNRRRECEEAMQIISARYPEAQQLRDVNLEQLESLKNAIPPTLFQRCRHVITENQRVLDAVQALENGDFAGLGALMFQSHASLRDDYAVSCPELDFLVEAALKEKDILGCRMMGGGFGGCVLMLIDKSAKAEYLERISPVYSKSFSRGFSSLSVTLGSGTRIC